MIITADDQLPELLNLVHDHWFNVERITLDKQQNTVSIYLERKKASLSKDSNTGIGLLIRNAESLTITDTERVRDYDLNDIKYDSESRSLIITGGIPIRIQIEVTSLHITTAVGNRQVL